MKLVIDRSRWLRGESSRNSFLKRSGDGRMCCLGFLGKACGYIERELEDRETPATITDKSKWPASLGRIDGELMNVNDTYYLDDATRENNLRQLFNQIGIDLEFIDGPVTA